MKRELEVILDSDIVKTGIDKVFVRNNYLPSQLFVDTTKSFFILFMDEYLFSEGNSLLTKKLNHFFASVSDYVYITSSAFSNYSVHSVKFDSSLTFEQLIEQLDGPLGYEVSTNWTNDYFYDNTSRWGVYHLHDAFCLIVGYEKSLESLIKTTILSDNFLTKPASFFFELMTQYRSKNEKESFVQKSIQNNPWLEEVKIYSM